MKHPDADVRDLIEAGEGLDVSLSAVQARRLLRFEELLRDRAVPRGMVAASDEGRLRERHVLDCLRAAALVGPARSAYDIGSGAGLPGVVVAIAVPDLEVGLVESRRGRVAFLELALEDLALDNVTVHARPVEDLTDPVDLCFARAFAPPHQAWSVARRLLAPGGRLVYFAGGSAELTSPTGVSVELVRTPVLASAGPLVIMSRL